MYVNDRFRSLRIFAVIAAMTAFLPAIATATTYKVDAGHSSVTFKVRHLFTSVSGRFDKFDGEIHFDPKNPEATKVRGTIDAASINTNLAKRDSHLRADDFFHTEKYPTITFESTGVANIDSAAKTGTLEGKLKLRGVEKPIEIKVSYLGEGKDPWGNKKAGFRGTLKINRKDYGLSWNETLETGGVLVGEEVEIEIEVEASPH